MVAKHHLALAGLVVAAGFGCDKKSDSLPGEAAPKPAVAAPGNAAPAPAPEPERAARTPKSRRMPLAEPLTKCDGAGTWKLEAQWRKGGSDRCKGAPTRKSFEFAVAERDGEFEAALAWPSYTASALEITFDGTTCLLDLQVDSQRVPGAGLIFNLSEKDGVITGEGMYEAPIDLDSGDTCMSEFDVTGTVVRK